MTSDRSLSETDWGALLSADRVVLLTDLDGTLIPFAASADQAELADDVAAALRSLTAAGVQVVAVSGRPRALIDRLRARVPGAWWVAEHGGWYCSIDGWTCVPTRGDDLDELARRLGAAIATCPGARLEHRTASLCLHWRQVSRARQPALLEAAELVVDEWLESHPDHERVPGVQLLEVSPRAHHKGQAVAWVHAQLPGARIIALGDDASDEHMFGALAPGDLAIAVGAAERPTRAALGVDDVAGAQALLRWLIEARAGRVAGAAPVRRLPIRTVAIDRTSLLVVSNRMPSPEPTGRREVGGLVAALEPALADRDAIWLGWSGQEQGGVATVITDARARPTRATFDLAPHLRQLFYGGFCNRSLWPLLHGFPSRVRYEDREWSAYVEANNTYARLAAELVDPDGPIWVHDYHLFLVAAGLRHRGHRGPIGLFLHVPFPPPDVFETMPWARELLDGILAFDLIGFHTHQWTRNFVGAVHALTDVRERDGRLEHRRGSTALASFPLGIDAEPFRHDQTQMLCADIEGLRTSLHGRKLLLGVDRLDYSKGIPQRLEGFARLLERYPQWRDKVCFVQVSVPSRADVPEYAELRREIEHLVGSINGRFAEADWLPVRYLYRSYKHDVLAQLYREADVGVVTPLRDGMNLVAKEFVAAQDPAQPGVLVLSRFAGAAEELRAAVLTNPFHCDGLADDLHQALSMQLGERRDRHARLRDAVLATTPTRWAASFLDALDAARSPAIRERRASS